MEILSNAPVADLDKAVIGSLLEYLGYVDISVEIDSHIEDIKDTGCPSGHDK
jgi:hypothetical protein